VRFIEQIGHPLSVFFRIGGAHHMIRLGKV